MKRIRHALMTALALATPLCCAAADVPFAGASSVRAQRIQEPSKSKAPIAGPMITLPPGQGEAVATQRAEVVKTNPAAKKWEYCAITHIVPIEKGFRSYTPAAVIRYFPNGTEQIEGTSDDDARANAIAKLGDEGWELVGIAETFSLHEGNGRSSPILYFKRPK